MTNSADIDYGNDPSKIAMRKHFPSQAGFTLIEVLVAVAILSFSLCGLLVTYINMFFLSDLARDSTLATNALQGEMEEIKKTNFDNLLALNGTSFEINGFTSSNAKGRIEVTDTTYADLKRVRLVACFKSRDRLIGEDTNLNGILNSGEDINGNSRLDSPLELVTLIAK